MLCRIAETPPSGGVVRCAVQPQYASISPLAMNRLMLSRRPVASCCAMTSQPVARKRLVASSASASFIASTGATRADPLPVHDIVGLITNG